MKRSRDKAPAQSDFRLEAFLPFRLNRLAAEVSRRLSTVYAARYGLDIPEWRVLATVSSRSAATARDIVTSTRTHKSTISRAVATLTERGLIERQESSDDGREVVLRLSQDGQTLMRELIPLVLEGEQQILDRLTGQKRLWLLASIAAIEAALGLDKEETAP
jgi:DNA-binding MarR family transcriptional regulator